MVTKSIRSLPDRLKAGESSLFISTRLSIWATIAKSFFRPPRQKEPGNANRADADSKDESEIKCSHLYDLCVVLII